MYFLDEGIYVLIAKLLGITHLAVGAEVTNTLAEGDVNIQP